VAHVDHGLRKTSAKTAAWLQKLIGQFNLPFHLLTLKPPPPKTNIEAWGRTQRYSFFEKIRITRKLDYVLTAHTANDRAETLLMRILSNKRLTTIAAYAEDRKLIRPLLQVYRGELLQFAKAEKIKWHEDETNAKLTFLRNRVRRKLIPFLEQEFEKSILRILNEQADGLEEDSMAIELMVDIAAKQLENHVIGTKPWLRALKSELTGLPLALAWRLVERVFIPLVGYKLDRFHAQRVLEFLERLGQGLELPGGIEVRPKAGGLVVRRLKS